MQISNKLCDAVQPKYLMDYTYHISKYERNSGSPEELQSFKYIEEKLQSFGLETKLSLNDAYISLPLDSNLSVAGEDIPCITTSMSAATGEDGIEAQMVFIENDEQLIDIGSETKGKILIFKGFATRDKVQKATDSGAKGCIFINGEHLHNMNVSRVWGNPTIETINQLPIIPIVNIDQFSGEKVIAWAKNNKRARMVTRVDEGWRKVPTLIAEVKGQVEPEKFILFSGHVDSWHYGAMDNASANAAMMEVARILAQMPLRRSLRLAFWSGHSHGRYAGSTNYFDENYQEIYDHCLMHVNIDSVGAKGATIVTEGNIMALTKDLATKIVKQETGQDFKGKPFGRSGDQSFWGAGVPSAFMGFSGQPMPSKVDKLDTLYMIKQFNNGPESSGFGWWWHTKEDTFDKIDEVNLARDTRVYLSFIYHSCNDPIVPLDITAGAYELQDEIFKYKEKIDDHVSMANVIRNLNDFMAAVERLDQTIVATSDDQLNIINEATHCLARVIVRLMQVDTSIFNPDPAVPMPTLPLLAPIHKLDEYKDNEHKYLMLVTEIKRKMNQVSFILQKGAVEAHHILGQLK